MTVLFASRRSRRKPNVLYAGLERADDAIHGIPPIAYDEEVLLVA